MHTHKHDKPHFRSWKSGKRWLYAVTAIAALMAAGGLSTTVTQASVNNQPNSGTLTNNPQSPSTSVDSSLVSSDSSNVVTASTTYTTPSATDSQAGILSSAASSSTATLTPTSEALEGAATGAGDATIPTNGWDSTNTSYYKNSKKVTGQQYISGHWYLFNNSGAIQTGFQNLTPYDQSKTVYYNSNGQMLYGQQLINNHWYDFAGGTGAQLIGRQWISNQSKWVLYNRSLGAGGYMLYGQQNDQGHWYLFDAHTGAMQYGFQNLTAYGQSKVVYYDAVNGTMLYGQQHIQGHWYLFDAHTGAMQTGFQNLAGYGQNKIVYYNNSGQMLYGKQNINGLTVTLDNVTGAATSITPKDITYFSQKDSRWANNSSFGGTALNFGKTGCGPTVMAMVIDSLLGANYSPVDVGTTSYERGGFNGPMSGGSGTAGNAMIEVGQAYGLKSQVLTSQNQVQASLLEGQVVVIAVQLYSGTTHWEILSGYSDGSTYVTNPLPESYPGKNTGLTSLSELYNSMSTNPLDNNAGKAVFSFWK